MIYLARRRSPHSSSIITRVPRARTRVSVNIVNIRNLARVRVGLLQSLRFAGLAGCGQRRATLSTVSTSREDKSYKAASGTQTQSTKQRRRRPGAPPPS